MPSFNKIELMGNLTRDPELRHTSKGTPVANFGLAVNNPRSKEENAVTYFDCTAWRETGQIISQYKQKGELVFISGRVEQDSWTDKTTGETRSKHVVVVEDIQFLPSGNGNGSGGSGSSSSSGGSAQTAAQPAGAPDFSEDDIPFAFRDHRHSIVDGIL